MTEDDAEQWMRNNIDVSCETYERLQGFIAFLKEEATRQNLVAATTLDQIWSRHVVDSAQLLRFAPDHGDWLDLGSGAGFPGLIIAMFGRHRVTLVESRAKRIDYLRRAVDAFVPHGCAAVAGTTVERLEPGNYSVISARAFAPLPRLLRLSQRFSTNKTLWLLPKGRNAAKELDEAHASWNLDFQVQPSLTDAGAGILVGRLLGERSKKPVKGQKRR
jgi:16S rRNA (guanine527-N7)-methyltransferase